MSKESAKTSAVDKEYIYANGYHHFHNALDNLCRDPDAQCEIIGWFNVAWELRDDAISSGRALLAIASDRLSKYQREAVIHLIASLNDLPGSVVNTENTKKEHARVLRSVFWASIREEARKLKISLEQETARVKLVLWAHRE